MKNGKLVALSAITTALGVGFLMLGVYFETLDLSCLFMASLVMMLPLAKGSVKGALLTYMATAILALVIGFARYSVAALYAMFFGIHPILSFLQFRGEKKRFYFYIIKAVLFLAAAYLMFFLFNFFVIEHEIINEYLPYIIFLVGTPLFIVYDLIMIRFQKYTNLMIKKIGL